MVDTLALNRYFRANVYTIWVHGPLGYRAVEGAEALERRTKNTAQPAVRTQRRPWILRVLGQTIIMSEPG